MVSWADASGIDKQSFHLSENSTENLAALFHKDKPNYLHA